jgi:phenylacetate-CoA ligase
VAQRCRAGRFHANAELCLVEILDDDGMPCAPGDAGRLVVTALRNPAMPLLRYDSGDLAEAVGGACPCGRTLPSFGRIVGRYRRMAAAPEGTSLQVFLLKKALESMPAEVNANLRQYQIRQRLDGSYSILLKVAAPLPAAFETWVRRAWRKDLAGERPGLEFRLVDAIPLSASGKVEDFVSDFADGGEAASDGASPASSTPEEPA